MPKIYHINLEPSEICGATLALIPGDPFRVPAIAATIQKAYGGQVKELAWKREFRTVRCTLEEGAILVTSTGIGGPSSAIVIEELALCGIRKFLRVGTTGAIQKKIQIGDVIITSGAVRLDGASKHYAPVEYPAVAHHSLIDAAIRGAQDLKLTYHVGITASSDTFYPGQERYDSFSGYVLPRLQGSLSQWQHLHVLNYEMESATVLTLANALGLQGGCVSGVVVNRVGDESITSASLQRGEDHAIKVAVAACKYLCQTE